MFETFDHTADLGLRVAAGDLAGLLVEAARGLTSLIVENPDSVEPTQARALHIDGLESDYLLFDWLTEILYLSEVERFVGNRFEIRLSPGGLDAVVHGETLDPSRHRASHEVKAITYHGLTVRQTPSGWEAELIVDI